MISCLVWCRIYLLLLLQNLSSALLPLISEDLLQLRGGKTFEIMLADENVWMMLMSRHVPSVCSSSLHLFTFTFVSRKRDRGGGGQLGEQLLPFSAFYWKFKFNQLTASSCCVTVEGLMVAWWLSTCSLAVNVFIVKQFKSRAREMFLLMLVMFK